MDSDRNKKCRYTLVLEHTIQELGSRHVIIML